MEKAGLNITPKEFKELSKLAENAYNITVVIDYFCKNQPEIEELYNLAPVIENLRMNADKLNAFFIDNGIHWNLSINLTTEHENYHHTATST